MSRIDELLAELCPQGVAFRSLGEVAEVRSGWGFPNAYQGSPDGTYPFYKVSDMNAPGNSLVMRRANNYVSREIAARLGVSPAPPGTVVFPKIGAAVATNKKRLLSVDSAYDNNVMGIVPSSALLPRYFLYWMQTFDLSRIANDSGAVPSIRKSEMLQVPIPVPPVEVQREIVKVLDTFTALEAELEAELEARQLQYSFYRNHLLTFPTTDGVPWVTLEDVASFTNAKPHERLVDPNGDVALMTSRFISTQGRSARYVHAADVLTPAHKDDVALVMSDLPNGRALARAFFVDSDGKYAANQRVCLLTVGDKAQLLPRFLYYIVDRNKQLLAYDSGVDQTHLKKGYILAVQIPVPPIAEQERIVDILDRFDALVNDLSIGLPAELKARRQQYEYYRDKLLSFDEAVA
ncbi:MAG: restriction endonuclease subunit S [Jatrophihabitantaceae bacterium]